MGSDYGVKATFDDSEIVAAFKRIDDNINRMAKAADASFQRVRNSGARGALEVQKAFETVQKSGKFSVKQLDDATIQLNKAVSLLKQSGRFELNELGNSAQLSGTQIGLVSGAVSALTTALINMGAQGIRALASLGAESVNLANRLDTTTAQFVGIFRGNKEAATAALEEIRAESRKLGIDLTELAAAFLPQVSNIEEFERLAKVAAALAKAQPEQGALGARIALQEAQSGDLLSLRRRFEMPEESINRIKEAQKEFGNTQGLIIGLEAELKRLGRDLNTLGGTAQTQFDIVKTQLEDVGATAGKPILEALKNEAADFSQFLSENREEILLFAENLGKAAGSVIEFVGNLIDIKNVDATTLVEFSEKVLSTVTALELFINQLIDMIGQMDAAKFILGAIVAPFVELWNIITRLDEALITATQILGIYNASMEGLRAAVEPTVEIIGLLIDTLNRAAHGDFEGAADSFNRAITQMKKGALDITGAQDAFRDSILKTNEAIDQYNQTITGQNNKQKQLKTSIDQTKSAALQQADAILKANKTVEKANQSNTSKQLGKLAAYDPNNPQQFAPPTKTTKTSKTDTAATIKAAREEAEQATKELTEISKKREKLEETQLQKTIESEKKARQKIKALKTDIKNDEKQLLIKQAQERAALERGIAEDRIAAEKQYQRDLQDNIIDFRAQADEASRTRDVAGFFGAVREKEQADAEAKLKLDRELEDIRTGGVTKRAELKIQQDQELAQQRAAAQQRLQELKQSLEDELTAQREAHEQELEELRQQEAEKKKIKEDAEEDVKKAEKPKKKKKKFGFGYGGSGLSLRTTPLGSNPFGKFGGYFKKGGAIRGKTWNVVGEDGPELLYSPNSARVLSNNDSQALMYSQPNYPSSGNSTTIAPEITLNVPADRLTPGQRVEARRIALEVQKEVAKAGR